MSQSSTLSPYQGMPGYVRVSKEIGGRTLSFETGVVARQAGAAIVASFGESTVLATVVRANPRDGIDFFPLTVDYREKLQAAGKFPGGFRKREGPPSEKEILTMRMIDRPIRPLFPDGFLDEVLIQVFVMSHDGENDTDMLAGTAAAACLAISDIPFEGPLATVRVARIHTDSGVQLVVNPTVSQLEFSDMDLVLSGHADGLNMIEVGAAEISEKDMVAAIQFGQGQINQVLELVNELTAKVGKPKVTGQLHLPTAEITEKVKALVEKDLTAARRIPGKKARNAAVDALRSAMMEKHFSLKLDGNYGEYSPPSRTRRWPRRRSSASKRRSRVG